MVSLTFEVNEVGEALIQFEYGTVAWNIRVPTMYTIDEYIEKFYTGTSRRHQALKKYLERNREAILEIEDIRRKIK